MKNGFPNLKNIYLPPQTAGPRARSATKPQEPTRYDLTSSADLSATPVSPVKQDFSMLKEVALIDIKLDSKEIELKNANFPENLYFEIELKNYVDYLSEISQCVKQKDAKLCKSLLRGIVGYERVAKKILTKLNMPNTQKLVVAKVQKVDEALQTEDEKFEEPVLKFCSTPELESIKQLGSTLRKIKVSRITGQLCDLYDSLSKMYTEIPEATASPEPSDIEMLTPTSIITMHLKVIKRNLSNLLSLNKPDFSKSFEAKACQDDFSSFTAAQPRVVEALLQEKDFEIKKSKKKYRELADEKRALEDTLARMKIFYSEVEKKHNETEIEVAKLKTKNSQSASYIEAQAKKINFLELKLQNKTSKLYGAKIRIEDLKKVILKEQEKLHKVSDELFNLKILFRINEEKLFQVEKAWERKIGRKYEHRDADKDAIINRYKIEKEYLEDESFAKLQEDIESNISDNDYPDSDSYLFIQKSHEDLLYIEKLEKNHDIKKSNLPSAFTENLISQEQIMNKKETEQSEKPSEQSEEESYGIKKKKRLKKLKLKRKIETEGSDLDYSEDISDEDILGYTHKKTKLLKSGGKNKCRKKRTSESFSVDKTHSRSKSSKPTKNETIKLSMIQETKPNQPVSSNLLTPKITFSLVKNIKSQSKSPQLLPAPTPISKKIQDPDSFFSSVIEFQYDFDNQEVDDLKNKENDILASIEKTENEIKNTLNEEGQTLFERYKDLSNELKNIRILLNMNMKSIGVQCIFDKDDTLIMKINEKAPFINTNNIKKIVDWKSTCDPLEVLKGNEGVQKILNTMFDSQTQIDMLSVREKQEIINSLKGHQINKCKDMCPHLQRVMRIKWRARGTPYPMKNIVMKSEQIKHESTKANK